jgi:tetratricopeptide (TPR) repeat protein
MARVDSLLEAAKEVLRTGSVIEREFSYELIERVAGIPGQELLAHLSALKDSELINERGIYPQSTYIFKHVLTREVVYNSLLTSRKRTLHEKIGQAIEHLSTENIDEQCGVLTEHFIRSENYEKGAEYSELAGKKVARAASYSDAIEYAKKRVFCLERLPKTDATQRQVIDTRTVLAGYYLSSSRLVEAKEAVAPIVDLALELNYQKRLPGIHIAIGLYSLWVEEDYQKGLRHLDEVYKISEKADDSTSFYMPLWHSSYYLGITLAFLCEFKKSLDYIKRCLDLSRAANDLLGAPFARGNESLNCIFQGKIDRAHQTSEEALQMAREIGAMFVEGMAFSAYGTSCYYKGLFDEAEINLLKGLDFCERTVHVVWGSWAAFALGALYFDLGRYGKAEDYYLRGLSILEPGEILPSWVKLFEVAVARARILGGDRDVDLSELFRYYKDNKFKVFQVWMARYIGEILLNIDEEHVSDAENWIKEAIETDKRNGMKWFLARDYTLYAELMKRKGDKSKARENLDKAIQIFKECGSDGWIKKHEKELAALS